MLLRFLLVSVVTGLGCDLPSRADLMSWSRSGSAWVQARMDDVRGARLVAAAEANDARFAVVVDAMAADFTADLAAAERPRPSALLAFEPIAVDDAIESGLVASFDYANQGVGRFVEVAGPPATLANAPALEAHPEPTAPGRATRLASALRLTRQAATAWAGLLSSGPDSGASVLR